MNTRYLVLGLGLVAVAWAFRKWRAAVQFTMVLVVFEGAVRKWVLPGAQDLVYFAKDALLVGAYAGFLAEGAIERVRDLIPPGLTGLLTAVATLGVFSVANPALPTPLLGILGVKSYFLYIPLLWVLPATFDSDREIARFLKRTLLLVIPVGVLAGVQFFSPSTSWLNVYARGGNEGAFSFGSSAFVRVTGTFSFISGYSAYLLASGVLLLGILATIGWRITSQLWVYACLALTISGMLMTGSRGPVFTLLLLLPLYWFFSLLRERQAPIMFLRFAGAVLILTLATARLAPQAVEAFTGRVAAGTDVGGRFSAPFRAPFILAAPAGLVGFGIGATHQAASAVVKSARSPYWLRGLDVEVEPGRVMLELGPIGFTLWYLARIALMVFALVKSIRLKTRFHRSMGIAAGLYLLAQLPGAAIFDPTASIYHWFLAALATTMIALDRRIPEEGNAGPTEVAPALAPDFNALIPRPINPAPVR
jgi:hypothetical protein